MELWRLTRRPYADLNGAGGELADGRWHTRGRPIVDCATSAALAVLEVRVHLDLPLESLPDDYVLMKITGSDDLDMRSVDASQLPVGWANREDLCRPIGDAWLSDGATALLKVPSAVVPMDRNVLLNPRHSDARLISVVQVISYPWDGRLFK